MKSKLLISIGLVFLLAFTATVVYAAIAGPLVKWSANEETEVLALIGRYDAYADGIKSTCIETAVNFDCDIIGITNKSNGFEWVWKSDSARGPDQILLETDANGFVLFIVVSNGQVDQDIVPSNLLRNETVVETTPASTKEVPTIPVSTPTSEDDDSCGHYGPWATPGPNGPYKCGGGK